MKILTVLLVLVLSGCSVMTPWVDEGGEELAYRVDQYCDEVDGSVREMFRESINKNLKDGRKVVVECGDEL